MDSSVGVPLDPRLVGTRDEALGERQYRRMLFIRRFEEMLLSLFDKGVLNGTTHACIGQEADCVGVIDHLGPNDHIFSNHRCHGHYLAKTGDAFGLLCEIMGKNAGVCRGIGGSQHLCAPGFKSNGILGGTVPAAAGIALAMSLRGEDGVSVVFLGDGTMGEGVVYETLNIASLWSLPLLLVVEDNGWSQSTPRWANMAGDIPGRIRAFDVHVDDVSSTDVGVIAEAAGTAVSAIRRDRKPRGLVLRTYRLCHHSKNDDNRPKDEVEARWALDPLRIHGAGLGAPSCDRIEAEVGAGLDDVLVRAMAAQ